MGRFAELGGVIIHSGDVGSQTAERLARALNCSTLVKCSGQTYRATTPVISYGTSPVIERELLHDDKIIPLSWVINKPEASSLACDKTRALRAMFDDGVSVPTFIPRSQVLNALSSGMLKFPLIARTRTHTNGSGLWVCLYEGDVELTLARGASHYLEFVKVLQEYRVYLYRQQLVKVIKKVPSTDVAINLVVRSNDYGWNWDKCDSYPDSVVREALAASQAIGMDLCSVDVATTRDERVVVFEVNGASWMSSDTARLYAELINKDFTEE